MAQRKVSCEVYTDRGIVGKEGADGKSAYQQAVEGGYQGTEEEFEQALASDISVVADNVTNINVVGNNIENVNTVAGNATNINTVATNISSINTAATNMPAIIAAPTEAANAANSATEASASATIATTQAELAKGYADSIDLSNYRTASDQDIIDATKQDTITDLETIRSGSSAGATAVQPGDLATVAISGMYSDLTGKPGAATADTLGLVKPDGTTITVTEDGTISSVGGSSSGFDFEGTKAEFDAAVAAGTITEDSVSLITDDVDGANVATKAELQAVDSSKADTNLGNVPSNYDYVVESYNDGTNWYRKYKSGWIEQGGKSGNITNNTNQTINLLKPFTDTNFYITIGHKNSTFDAFYYNQGCIINYTETTIVLSNRRFNSENKYSMIVFWYACGQGAQ